MPRASTMMWTSIAISLLAASIDAHAQAIGEATPARTQVTIRSDGGPVAVSFTGGDSGRVDQCTTPCRLSLSPGTLTASPSEAYDARRLFVVRLDGGELDLRVQSPSNAPHIVGGFLMVQSAVVAVVGLLGIAAGATCQGLFCGGTEWMNIGAGIFAFGAVGLVTAALLLGIDTAPRIKRSPLSPRASRGLANARLTVAATPGGAALLVVARF